MNIDQEYTTPSFPKSFSGKTLFIEQLRKKYKNLSKQEINDWFLNNETYTIHKPIRKKFLRNKVIVNGIDDTWQADLVDLTSLAHLNDNFKFILTVIDVFSKYAFAIPLKNKSSKSIVDSFKNIIKNGRQPKKLQTDAGNEFINKSLKNYLKNVKMYTTYSEMKASIVERFNRTLKEKMWRYFSYNHHYRWIDVLPDLILSYNNSYHRSIKRAPVNVKKNNEKEVFDILYNSKPEFIKFKFKVGDKVRISKSKTIFEKGYTPNFTREIFIIHERLPRMPPVYRIKDFGNEVIKGVFYEEQLQKVLKENDVYFVSDVIKERTKNGKKEYFVRWLGYPDKFNSWEPLENFINLENLILDNKSKEKNDRFIFAL